MANSNYANFIRAKAIKETNKRRILKINPNVPNTSGIYFLTRTETNGMKFAYVGQAVHLIERLAEHLTGYQHIDLSIRKHGLYSDTNQCGYKIDFKEFPRDQLDEMERYYIKEYANNGYQLRNKTAGGQDIGKIGIDDNKPSKGYHDGLKAGYEKCRKEVAEFFEKYLEVSIKGSAYNKNGSTNVLKQRKFNEFKEFLAYVDNNKNED